MPQTIAAQEKIDMLPQVCYIIYRRVREYCRRGECTILSKVCHSSLGELSEWLKEHAWKACVRRTLYREFESLTLRHEISAHCLAMRFYILFNVILFNVGPQCLGPAQWSLANPVRPGREQR